MFGYAWNFLQVWVKTFIGINYNNLLHTGIFAPTHYFLMFTFYALKRVTNTKSYISLHRHVYFFTQYIHIVDIQYTIYTFISGFYLMACDLWFTFGFWVSTTKTLVDLSRDESKTKIIETGNWSAFSPFLHYFMTWVKKMFNWILYIHNIYIMLIIFFFI